MDKAPTDFELVINGLLGFVMNELGRGRMTAIQADLIKEHVAKLEAAHTLDVANAAERAADAA